MSARPIVPTTPSITDSATSRAVDALKSCLANVNEQPIVFGVPVAVKATGAGLVTVNHGLGRLPIGYLPMRQTAGAPGYPQLASSTTTQLTLLFAGAFTGAYWVF